MTDAASHPLRTCSKLVRICARYNTAILLGDGAKARQLLDLYDLHTESCRVCGYHRVDTT